jgi:hypothetical protein
MVDSAAGVFGPGSGSRVSGVADGLTTVRMHGPGRDVAIQRRETPPDGAGAVESAIWAKPVGQPPTRARACNR